MEVAIIFIALFGSAFGIFYIYFVTRNRERMALMESGADFSQFNHKTVKVPKERKTYNQVKFTLKFGMFLIGLGMGFVIAVFLKDMVDQDLFPLTVIGTVFICGGIGMVAGYYTGMAIDKKKSA